jgi:serine protease
MQRSKIMKALAASIALALFMGFQAQAQVAIRAGDLSTRINTSSLSSDTTYGRFIVRYRDDVSSTSVVAAQDADAAMARAAKLQASLSSQKAQVTYRRRLATGAHLVTTSRKLSPAEATAFMQALAGDPAVAYVAPDVMRQRAGLPVQAAFAPNDPFFARYQTDYLPGDGSLTAAGNAVANWGGANITGAWQLADGAGVTIAVLDTGMVRHADIDTSLGDAGYDFIGDSYVSGRAADGRAQGGWDLGDWTTGAPYSSGPDACTSAAQAHGSSWHGSHVASASGAERTNNGVGMAGVAYRANVLPVRVLGHCGGYDSDIADAIVWASGGRVDGVPENTHPAQVINMSLGGRGVCTAGDVTAQAIAKARANGATVVVSAGNSGAEAASYSPASCPGVIAVASVGVGSGLAYYSNYNRAGDDVVKLGAFGGGVYGNDGNGGATLNPEGFAWQAINSGATTPAASPAGDTYGGMAGTSQAAPHVTGAIALMQSARLGAGLSLLTPDQVLTMLQRTARAPHTPPIEGKTFGAGILDAGAAVAAAVADAGPQPAVVALQNGVALDSQSGAAGSEAFYKIDVPANARALVMRTAGGAGDVSLYVRAGAAPASSLYDASSVHVGNAESVVIARVPVASTYYLRVVAEQPYEGLIVQAAYTP